MRTRRPREFAATLLIVAFLLSLEIQFAELLLSQRIKVSAGVSS